MIDPTIPLQVQHPSLDIPAAIQAGRDASQREQHNAMAMDAQRQQMGIAQQNSDALTEERQALAAERRQQGVDRTAVDEAVQPGRTRQEALDATPGHLRAIVGKMYDDADEADTKSKKAKIELEKAETEYAATLALGVRSYRGQGPEAELQAAQYAIRHAKEKGHDVSEIEGLLAEHPEAVPHIVDGLIAKSTKHKASEGYSLSPGGMRLDANNNIVAQAPFAPKDPKGQWVPDYDEVGKPISRFVEEGPGATAPRQETPQRPTVLAPGAKAVDATGATIAEGNPIERQPQAAQVAQVDTVNEAGQPVTKLVERTPGQEFPKPPAQEPRTRPRQVAPGSKEAYFVAYAQKIGKRPDELSLEDQVKALQGYSRADDKPEKPKEAEKKKILPAGTAAKLADMDNSLNELGVLRETLLPNGVRSGVKMTGAAAAAGAHTFDWITDLTGIGSEAKQRQAVIDRVKQVIGKALEGGVLRKEDEDKYKKILPTISDTEDVVDSKLNGLAVAIRDKKQVEVDAFDDAGYDMGKFAARAARGKTTPKVAPKVGDKVGRFEIVGVK